jgi:hypothetical protein
MNNHGPLVCLSNNVLTVFMFQVVKDYQKSIIDFYSKCSDEKCRLLYVRSMGNSGLPDFKEKIFETISNKDSSSMLGFTSVQALRRIPPQYMEEKVGNTVVT